MRLYSFSLPGWVNPADAFCLLYAGDETAFWLDREHHPGSPYSVLGHGYGNQVFDFNTGLEALADLEAALESAPGEGGWDGELPFDFRPGLVGWLRYRGFNIEADLPQASLMLVREALVFDHRNRRIFVFGLFESEAKFRQWLQGLTLRIWFSGGQAVGYQMRVDSDKEETRLTPRDSKPEYLALIARAQSEIAAGEVYQLCLANELSGQTKRDPLAVYLRLRGINPAPFASYLRMGDTVLASSSPEQFLGLSRAGKLTTKPIKGTRPRLSDPAEDEAMKLALRENVKERAENLMIVDLMRNDLGRVAQAETVAVENLFEVESYATVHQLVSTVTAQKLSTATTTDVIAATFPAGSMTGAPKLRAMELIDELEGSARGVYSGVAGWFGIDGAFELAMNIRSLVFEGERVSIGVGGGITSDSSPEAEYEETKIKAAALLEALEASCDW